MQPTLGAARLWPLRRSAPVAATARTRCCATPRRHGSCAMVSWACAHEHIANRSERNCNLSCGALLRPAHDQRRHGSRSRAVASCMRCRVQASVLQAQMLAEALLGVAMCLARLLGARQARQSTTGGTKDVSKRCSQCRLHFVDMLPTVCSCGGLRGSCPWSLHTVMTCRL